MNTVNNNIEQEVQHQELDIPCCKRDYCVAIRTLGTAGEKYQTLLDSLVSQTLPPKKILVYIPHGYPAPKETVGVEQIVRCEKGMITQRSLSFDEIDTDYVLFCDDDLFLPPCFVERMFDGLVIHKGDCIAASVDGTQWSKLYQIKIFLHSFVTMRENDGWGIKVKRHASYSFNKNPGDDFLLTESAPGASCLCKMNIYRSIHFEDERWMEKMKFPAGEDQLFYYKMYVMGYRVFLFYNSGLIHLDAQAGLRPVRKEKMYLQKKNMFTLWYRTIYAIRSKSKMEKLRCIMSFSWRCLFGVFTLPLEVIYYKQPHFFIDYFRGLYAGYKYVHSEEFKKIPPFDYYIDK